MSFFRRPQASHLWLALTVGFFVFVVVILVDQILHLVKLNQEELKTYEAEVRFAGRPFGQRIYRVHPPVDSNAETEIKMKEASEVFEQLVADVKGVPNPPSPKTGGIKPVVGKVDSLNKLSADLMTETKKLDASKSSRLSPDFARPRRAFKLTYSSAPTTSELEATAKKLMNEKLDVVYDYDEEVYDDGSNDLDGNSEAEKKESLGLESNDPKTLFV